MFATEHVGRFLDAIIQNPVEKTHWQKEPVRRVLLWVVYEDMSSLYSWGLIWPTGVGRSITHSNLFRKLLCMNANVNVAFDR